MLGLELGWKFRFLFGIVFKGFYLRFSQYEELSCYS